MSGQISSSHFKQHIHLILKPLMCGFHAFNSNHITEMVSKCVVLRERVRRRERPHTRSPLFIDCVNIRTPASFHSGSDSDIMGENFIEEARIEERGRRERR